MNAFRYDRTGERIEVEADELAPAAHPLGCDQGWIPVAADVPSVAPCPVCRPRLAGRIERSTTTPNRTEAR